MAQDTTKRGRRPLEDRINPEYLVWLLSLPLLERERLLGGNWKIGRRPGSVSSENGVPSSTRSRRISTLSAIGISPLWSRRRERAYLAKSKSSEDSAVPKPNRGSRGARSG
jgi:hypothetical protein